VSFQGEGASILHDPTKPPNGHLRPIDFSRQVVLENEPEEENGADAVAETAVTKLMKPDKPSMTPKVEIYPQKFNFKVVVSPQEEESASSRGASFLMASKTCQILDVLNAVMKTVAPQKASPCVRLWCKHQALRQDGKTNATLAGDGYELIDLENFQGKMDRPDITKEKSEMTVKEWVARRGGVSDLIVETRINNKTDWARESFELEYRVQVGDFVDAQDSTGKWYEAIVRDVSEDIVTVHYAGWATRWNGKIQRHPNGPKDVDHAAKCVVPIAPLWTHTTRWREGIEMGHQLEIRDSTSNVLQPKWFRGTVVKVGRKGGTPKDLYDGAMLEKLEAPTTATTKVHKNNMLPLLILLRMQQVLVEIPQEKHNNPALVLQTANDDDEENPPFIRWVNLYGEEICTPGTHMKILSDEKRPATINYDFDPRKPPVEILKTHLGSGFVRESLRGQPPAPGAVGLQNLGNSCFMNSIVQCLNHCDPVSEYFVSEEYAKDLNRRNPLGSGGRVAMAYASLLSDIWRGQYSALAPRLLKQTIANFAPQFNNVYQHDSHEFCSFLMDGIHEDCNRVDTKPYVEELEGFGVPDDKVAIESWRRHLLRHDSIIVDNCQGMHRSHVTCPICSRESIKFDVFSSLSVPLTSSKDRSFIPLDDCLEKFTEGEQLDENNAWYCPNCKKHVCALKMLALWSVPDILIIHLKRFTYEQKRNGSVVRSKIEDRVVFPVDGLDMSPYLLGPVDEAAPPIFNVSILSFSSAMVLSLSPLC
jgi:ubiquitin carboxyl-terminal hydrolase 8